MLEDEMWLWVTSDTNLNMIQIDSKHGGKNWIAFSEWPDVETTIIKWPLKKNNNNSMQNLWYVYRNTKQISVKHHQPPHQENTDDCRGFWVMALVFEHVTQEFLHGSVSDGPVEEQQLYPLRIHKTQRGEKKKQLPKPIKNKQDTKINNTNTTRMWQTKNIQLRAF